MLSDGKRKGGGSRPLLYSLPVPDDAAPPTVMLGRGRSRDWHGLKRLQLAATHAVLASVQSPSPHRPLYLSQVTPPVSPGQLLPVGNSSALLLKGLALLRA